MAQTSKLHFPALDGLRGVAIVAVMLYHVKTISTWSAAVGHSRFDLGWTFDLGWAGVDLFFVLSGFLITGILLDSKQTDSYYVRFYARRVLRIFPVYYVALTVILILGPLLLNRVGFAGQAQNVMGTRGPLPWLYLQNWKMSLFPTGAQTPLVGHFWSLCIEEQFYLVWPFLIRNLNRRLTVIFASFLVATAPFLRIAFHLIGMNVAAYELTVSRMDALAVGAILALTMRSASKWAVAARIAPWVGLCAATSLLILVISTKSLHPMTFSVDCVGLVLTEVCAASAVVIGVTVSRGALCGRLLTGRFLRFFGKHSYCLYVWHQPVIYVFAWMGLTGSALTVLLRSSFGATMLINVVVFVVSIAIALLSWNLFEKQFLALKRHFE